MMLCQEPQKEEQQVSWRQLLDKVLQGSKHKTSDSGQNEQQVDCLFAWNTWMTEKNVSIVSKKLQFSPLQKVK